MINFNILFQYPSDSISLRA